MVSMLNLIISLLVSLLANPFAWNTHIYPKASERKALAICKHYGGTKEQCQCALDKVEKAWTVRQSFDQGLYFIRNRKLTDEAWKIHISCLPPEAPKKAGKAK
jgi:hypothetical protein